MPLTEGTDTQTEMETRKGTRRVSQSSIDALRRYMASTARPLADRFWAKVEKTESCWLWKGSRGPSGHGVITAGGGHVQRRLRATAVSWEIAYGTPVPPGLDVCQHCDNPPCVRPDHLFLGTAKDNMQDAIAKRRFKFLEPRPGEANNNAKLTWPAVRQMRADYAAGASVSALSRRHRLARSSVREVVYGRTWVEDGITPRPYAKPTGKLTPTQLAILRSRVASGVPLLKIAREFNVSRDTVVRRGLPQAPLGRAADVPSVQPELISVRY